MNKINTFLVALAYALIFISSASAKDRQHNNDIALGQSNNHSSAQLGYFSKRNHDRHNQYRDQHHSQKAPSNSNKKQYLGESYRYHHYRSNQNHYKKNYQHGNMQVNKACHPTTIIVVSKHNHSHNVAGTMCYDAYGNSYVIEDGRSTRR